MAITFDAVDDEINLGSNSFLDDLDLQGGGGLSLSLWAYITGAGEGGFGNFMMKGASADSGYWQFGIDSVATNLYFKKDYATVDLVMLTTLGAVSSNAWHHLMVTWDGSATSANIKIYSDNVDVSGVGTDGVGSKNSDAANSLKISQSDITFQGNMTEVAIFNKVLSSAERSLLYNSGSPFKYVPQTISGLLGYWPMNEDTGGTVNTATGFVKDKSGIGNNGTQSGNPVYTAEPTNLVLPSRPHNILRVARVGNGMSLSGQAS